MAVLLWAQVSPAADIHTIAGCVKGADGAPVPGATVRLKELEGVGFHVAATADAKGCYRQEMIPSGAYELTAEQNGIPISRKQIVLDAKKRDMTVDLVYQPRAKAAPADAAAPPMINLRMLAWGNPLTAGKGTANSANSLVKSVTFTVGWIEGGDSAMGQVSLAKPAPKEGVELQLAVNNKTLAEVPPSITIGAGMERGWFPVKTSRVRGPSDVRLEVSASDGQGTQSAELTVRSYTRVTVTLGGTGSGRVVSVPGGLLCSMGTCTHPFRDGENVVLSPQPSPGSVFLGWAGDCDDSGVVVVSRPMKCTARFSERKP